MSPIDAIVVGLAVLLGAGCEQGSPTVQSPSVPAFSGFPAQEPYHGPAAKPRFNSSSEKAFLEAVLDHNGALAPNFAGQFRVVQFRIGSGPFGAVLIDSKTGSVFHLPTEIVRNNYFMQSTGCLAALRGLPWGKTSDGEDYSEPLSFKLNSELLVVSQCRVDGATVTAVDRSYYRWHGRKWHFLRRLASPPPPVY